MERMFRDSVLDLAREHGFARRLVNSGRLSRPCSLEGMSLQSASCAGSGLAPGTAMPDAPVAGPKGRWLLPHFGDGFSLMAVEAGLPATLPPGVAPVVVSGQESRRIGAAAFLRDTQGLVAQRYGAGNLYLIRPDQHVAARFAAPDTGEVTAANARATGRAA